MKPNIISVPFYWRRVQLRSFGHVSFVRGFGLKLPLHLPMQHNVRLARKSTHCVDKPQERLDLFLKIKASQTKREIKAQKFSPVKVSIYRGEEASGVPMECSYTPENTTPIEAGRQCLQDKKLPNIAIAIVDSDIWDANRPLPHDCHHIQLISADSGHPAILEALAHSAAHVLGASIEQEFEGVLLKDGPGKSDGTFYYNFVTKNGEAIPDNIVDILNVKAKRLLKAREAFERLEISPQEAKEMFAGNPYKLEYINDAISKNCQLSAYRTGPFVDLCSGPHIPSTSLIQGFQLTSIAENNYDSEQYESHRVRGVARLTKQAMREWEQQRQEQVTRSHQHIGKTQKLFMMHPSSPGSTFFMPQGTFILETLKELVRYYYKVYDFKEVMTPLIFNKKLWETSGHWDHYQDDMFFVSDCGHSSTEDLEYGLKPMNCPAHCLLFKNLARSHKDLPVRLADFSALHRNEARGALTGLTRVRQFHQDDGHIFCTQDQIFEEVQRCLEFVDHVYGIFGFKYYIKLSTRPEKYIGSDDEWDASEHYLKQALNDLGKPWVIDHGDGAFYGPKIDITLQDALGRLHQTATIQLDFQLPERFDLTYDDAEGKKQRPVIIHRAIFGSLERFFAVLCEHLGGHWPMWLNPRQVLVCPVGENFSEYASEVYDSLVGGVPGLRIECDTDNETLGKRLRRARELRYNYIAVVGAKEKESNTVSIRMRGVNTVESMVFLICSYILKLILHNVDNSRLL
eukprot:m.154147 g.154147  ORF g.154147 m.154147 type:complete len:741 (+) comp15076_c0_seq5:215-2437(+)